MTILVSKKFETAQGEFLREIHKHRGQSREQLELLKNFWDEYLTTHYKHPSTKLRGGVDYGCRYRVPVTNRVDTTCVIGACLPKDNYRPWMEEYAASSDQGPRLALLGLGFTPRVIAIMGYIQQMHDTAVGDYYTQRRVELAATGLKIVWAYYAEKLADRIEILINSHLDPLIVY